MVSSLALLINSPTRWCCKGESLEAGERKMMKIEIPWNGLEMRVIKSNGTIRTEPLDVHPEQQGTHQEKSRQTRS